MTVHQDPFIIGWNEWLALPDLGLPAIKAKVDTGAKTSALHAFQIEPFGSSTAPMVRFGVHPVPRRPDIAIYCSAPVVDRREVTSSNGEREMRYVVRTRVAMGERSWPVDITLTNRESMAYRMLLGRQAILEDMLVEPATSFRQPRLSYKLYRHLPRHEIIRRPFRIAVLTERPNASSNRHLLAAAVTRGHVIELLSVHDLKMVFDGALPGIVGRDGPLPHYDAVIARLDSEVRAYGAAVVRQLELMGSFALNPGDAIERTLSEIAVVQELTRSGIAHRARVSTLLQRGQTDAETGPGRRYRILVVGGRAVAAIRRTRGISVDPGKRKLREETALAERTAIALKLGLASVDVRGQGENSEVLRVSANPTLGVFEKVTGVLVAAAIVAEVESRVRSWVRRPDTENDA